jgi:hypothetical protein
MEIGFKPFIHLGHANYCPNFCIEKYIFYVLKRMIAQVPKLNYYIKFLN